jgi:transcriptional regulator with XRE-family HTH domain
VLKFARKALGLRQNELAELLRRNVQHLSRIENDDEVPMDLRLAVASLLQMAESPDLGSVADVGAHDERSFEIRKAS